MKQKPEIKIHPITKKNSAPKFFDNLKYIKDSNFNKHFIMEIHIQKIQKKNFN